MIANQVVRVRPDSSSDGLLALRDTVLREAPVEWARLDDLTASFTPRIDGVDGGWALTLAELECALPPILVHRPTMAVIDGLHRVRAARLKERERIEAQFFDGSEEDAALLAVAMNVTQGRPLSQADRTAAAERIVTAHPHWSDRAIAAVAGLCAKKVAEIRLHADDLPQCDRRVGLDGRARPLSTAQARELAGRLLRSDPGASLRAVARKAGLSPATVADVRDRLLRGEDLVPARQRGLAPRDRGQRQSEEESHAVETRSPDELVTIFDSLRRDPSLRLNEMGRAVLRMLDACSLIARDRQRVLAHVPPHCTGQMAELMTGYSEMWRLLADELRAGAEQDAQSGAGRP